MPKAKEKSLSVDNTVNFMQRIETENINFKAVQRECFLGDTYRKPTTFLQLFIVW